MVATTQSGTERMVGTSSNSMIGSQLHPHISSTNLHLEVRPRPVSRISTSAFLRQETLEDLKIVVEVEVHHLTRAEAGVGSGLPEETGEASDRGEDMRDLRHRRGSLALRVNKDSPALTGVAFTLTDSVRDLKEAREASVGGAGSEDITVTKTLTTAEEHLTEDGAAVEAGMATGDPGGTLGVEAELAGNCEE